ncbi:RNA-binding protein 4.1-like [Pholidichthys leucotaenia]
MVKIFVGNLPREADEEELTALFSEYGKVTECAIIKNFAFVHMDDRKAATKAIKNLHHHKLHFTPINVEASRGKNQFPVKLHVANVEKGAEEALQSLFEEYGTVTDLVIVKNFAFVHMANSEEAMDAINELDNSEFQGKHIHVQISKNRSRQDELGEHPFPPDRGSFWPPRYPGDWHEPPPPPFMRGRIPPGYPIPPLPHPAHAPPLRRPIHPDRPFEAERDRFSMVDYYERYRARQYGIPPYEDKRPGALPPPPPPAVVRSRLPSAPIDPYERRPLPPPPPPLAASYYGRDRSPVRRLATAPAPPASNGYSYDRAAYGVQRARDPFADRLPPPPPPRYAY